MVIYLITTTNKQAENFPSYWKVLLLFLAKLILTRIKKYIIFMK